MLMLFLLLLMGPIHPPTANDSEPLGPFRIVLGWLTLALYCARFYAYAAKVPAVDRWWGSLRSTHSTTEVLTVVNSAPAERPGIAAAMRPRLYFRLFRTQYGTGVVMPPELPFLIVLGLAIAALPFILLAMMITLDAPAGARSR